jgi:hypothetical protein
MIEEFLNKESSPTSRLRRAGPPIFTDEPACPHETTRAGGDSSLELVRSLHPAVVERDSGGPVRKRRGKQDTRFCPGTN